MAGVSEAVLLGGDSTFVLHCDYDAQAVVVEPITAALVNQIRSLTRHSHALLFHVGSHWRSSNPRQQPQEAPSLRWLPPPVHLIVTPRDALPQRLAQVHRHVHWRASEQVTSVRTHPDAHTHTLAL